MLCQGVSQQSHIENGEATERISSQSLNWTGVLCVDVGKQTLLHHGKRRVHFPEVPGGIGQRLMDQRLLRVRKTVTGPAL